MDQLKFVQGDTAPNPIFHMMRNSPTAGPTVIDLGSLATAYVRWAAISSPATVYLIPATVASGFAPSNGVLEAFIASVATGVPLATAGRYELQVVTMSPAGKETWPRDDPFPVVIVDRLGGV